ncbi:hypothetical protein [Nostoc sp.]|uniref:hypothetical protein n=1 Tax=Nostoc sp. TaxID=1180 RepID=UPI002FF0557A
MTSGALPANPFVAAGMIEDPRLFVGRKDELHAIASRMNDIGNWITGLVMLLLPVLVLVGVLHWNEVWDFVRDKLGIK